MARLPQPGGDTGNWGEILNEFLEVAHTSDGKLAIEGRIAINVKDPQFGAKGDGVTNDTASIQAAILEAANHNAAVYFPASPTPYIISNSLSLRSNIALIGDGPFASLIRASSGISTAMLLGTSGNHVSGIVMRGIGLVGNFSNGVTNSLNGVQITNGSQITIDSCSFSDFSNAAILLQGSGSEGGTPDCHIVNNFIQGTGLNDGTTGFGINIRDNSKNSLVEGNTLSGIKGGMGVGMAGSPSTGYPTDCRIVGNHITMAPSTTGFEGIGITANCLRCVIAYNNIVNSQDNGISASAAQASVIGNTVLGTRNHGIQLQGDDSLCVGNVVRNPGQEADASYGGISINNAAAITVVGNSCVDDQITPTMAYGIKVHTSGGSNVIALNRLSGYTIAPFGDNLTSTDILLDTSRHASGLTVDTLWASVLEVSSEIRNTGGTLYFNGDTKAKSRFIIGNNQNSALGQLTIQSTVANRVEQINVVASSQTADIIQNRANNGTSILSGMQFDGTYYSNSATGGIILKDANNHYWRITINTSGVLSSTDLGTSLPTS